MAVDERARHQLHQALERNIGADEADTLMSSLPPSGYGDLATKQDLVLLKSELGIEIQSRGDQLRAELRADMERGFRRIIMWTSSMVMTAAALAFAAGRFAF